MKRHRPQPVREATINFEKVPRSEVDWTELERMRHGFSTSEAARKVAERFEARLREEMARANSGAPFGQAPHARGIEVITDPHDQRGYAARRVGP